MFVVDLLKMPWVQACIEAVRSNPKIGRGSCSIIDECYPDEELVEDFILPHLQEGRITTPKQMVLRCLRNDKLRRDREEDIRNA